MRFSVSKQLIILAASLVILSVLVSSWLAYQNSKSQLETALGEELLALVNSTATFIDADKHADIVRVDQDFVDGWDSFEQVKAVLVKIKQANNLAINSHGSPIYTLRKSTGFDKSRKLEFVVMTDPDKNGECFVGHQISAEKHHFEALEGKSVATGLYEDSEGLWISATAPIHNAKGKVVGLVQADRHINFFYDEVSRIAKQLFFGAGVTIFIAVMIGAYYARRLTYPIKVVVNAAHAFGKGDFNQVVNINRDDEFGFLGQTFNKMASRIKESQIEQLKQKQALQKLSKDLVQANRGLEAKVAARTQELRKNHAELEEVLKSLQQSQASLVQSEKMASLGQLAAGVAHEINNPIAFVNSNLNTLKDYTASIMTVLGKVQPIIKANQGDSKESIDKAIQNYTEIYEQEDIEFLFEDINNLLDESIDGATRVKEIVADLKGYSRVDEEEYQAADINECLESTLKITHNETKYNSEIVKEFGELPDIMCNPGKLNQVFTNLIVNAAQAIEENGVITISTDSTTEYVIVKIADNGVGISSENLDRMFEAFFTTKPVGEGTGLGLYISYSIIQEHQGQLLVDSEVGKGTVFTIKLPVGKAMESSNAA